MYNIKKVRALFPHTKKSAYFNVASSGPLPDPAYKILEVNYRRAQMAVLGNQEELFTSLENIRKEGAKIFGCKPSEAGFGFNTTFGINLAAFGLPLKPGDEVLLHDVEFPANVYPWLELRNRGIKIKFIKNNNGYFDIDAFKKAITHKTRALSISFVQYFNGFKVDLAEIGRICKKHNIFFVVDVMQGAGAEPMHLSKWGVDIASAGAQKWLLSNQGTGIFYISEEMKKKIIAPWRSWLGVDWKCNWADLRDFGRDFDSSARQFEMGTYPSQHLQSLEWSLHFINELGIANIQKHNYALLDKLIAYLQDQDFYTLTSSIEMKHRSSILTFKPIKGDVTTIHRFLLKRGIVTAVREGSIRVSVHLYNDDGDIDKLIAALARATAQAGRK